MSQLLSFYEAEPINLKGWSSWPSAPMRESDLYDCTEGVIQARSVYVVAPSPAPKALLAPFGTYDDWSLRDRYNEGLRIMGDIGAREIECVTFRSVSKRSRFRFGIKSAGAEVSLQKVENSGFDFQHVGRGSEPRDPAPLKWPDEPAFEAARRSVLHNGASSVTINISGPDGVHCRLIARQAAQEARLRPRAEPRARHGQHVARHGAPSRTDSYAEEGHMVLTHRHPVYLQETQ